VSQKWWGGRRGGGFDFASFGLIRDVIIHYNFDISYSLFLEMHGVEFKYGEYNFTKEKIIERENNKLKYTT